MAGTIQLGARRGGPVRDAIAFRAEVQTPIPHDPGAPQGEDPPLLTALAAAPKPNIPRSMARGRQSSTMRATSADIAVLRRGAIG
jgi:hypothetical protein